MKIIFLADLHYVNYRDWEKFLKIDQSSFDAICLLGDIDTLTLRSIKNVFEQKKIFGVLGNHDFWGDLEYYDIENIHGKSIKAGRHIISGVGGSIRYKEEDAPLYSQGEIKLVIQGFNETTDIIISHNSPEGIHDKNDMAHIGYSALREFIDKKQPKYCLHGHQHRNLVSKVGNTTVICVYGAILLNTVTGTVKEIFSIPEDNCYY